MSFLLAIAVAGAARAAPVVGFAGIEEGQLIGGIYALIEAVVQSDLEIDRVEFFLDDHLFRTETIPPYAFNGDFQGVFYGWDTTIYPNGEYQIRADAYDELQNVGSATVRFGIFNNHPPTASCEASASYGNVPLRVVFTGHAFDADRQDLIFNWTFGDGAQSGEQNPEHTFTIPGAYIVRFTVVDPYEASASDQVSVRAGLLPHVEEDGMAVFEAEGYDLWFATNTGEQWSVLKVEPGYSGQGYIHYLPDGGVSHILDNDGPAVQYWIDFRRLGRYYVWVRGRAAPGSSSCKTSLNGQLATENLNWPTYGAWEWTDRAGGDGLASIDVVGKGVNILTIHGRHDGLAIDKIILTTEPTYTPDGSGPEAPPRAARSNPLPGDCNFDGVVNILDLIFVRNRLTRDVNVSNNRWADVNGDNIVNVLDLIFTRNHIGDRLTK